ncbi:MAG: hypothetical protein ABGY95_09970 [Rubritalea sp.]|uniref:hypothetical protein n=1 Tax=Rubritalea sp. TaxID=2109375 RepID=UPI0032425FBE
MRDIASLAKELKAGEDNLATGDSSAAVKGVVAEFRLQHGEEMVTVESAACGSYIALKHEGKAKRGDQLYKMVPIKTEAAKSV